MSDGSAKGGPGGLADFAVSALITSATAWAVLVYAAARGVERTVAFAARSLTGGR